MAKNLEFSMSPVTIGLKLDPTYPTRNDTSGNVHEGAYRTDGGIDTLESGDLVRFGSIVGVVLVDHQDKLAGADSEPVINFGLNVWRVKGIIKTAANGTAQAAGSELWYYDPTGSTVDNATSKGAANQSRLFAGQPTAANHSDLTAGTGRLYRIGTVLDSIAGSVNRDASPAGEIRVMIGGVATCDSSSVS